mmetsp:Transcript_33350/g.72070  ORF Transcript_33350/g.72070 Transcript_33350/m.72070 type:complete len:92 (-) Transcript_33350:515-790(-)
MNNLRIGSTEAYKKDRSQTPIRESSMNIPNSRRDDLNGNNSRSPKQDSKSLPRKMLHACHSFNDNYSMANSIENIGFEYSEVSLSLNKKRG